jgi:F0F1-type ATP synthase membrane subunit c/vacuolar-type H+-ATPase subunit K
MKLRKTLLTTLGLLMLLASQAASAFAQCAMCKASLQSSASASGNPEAVAQTFNLAVLVLLIPPVLIFIGFFLVLLRYRKGAHDGAALKTLGAFD